MKCVNCDSDLDRHSSMYDKKSKPEPGSFTLCLRCCQPYIFDFDLSLKPFTFSQFLNLDPEEKKSVAVLLYELELAMRDAARILKLNYEHGQ